MCFHHQPQRCAIFGHLYLPTLPEPFLIISPLDTWLRNPSWASFFFGTHWPPQIIRRPQCFAISTTFRGPVSSVFHLLSSRVFLSLFYSSLSAFFSAFHLSTLGNLTSKLRWINVCWRLSYARCFFVLRYWVVLCDSIWDPLTNWSSWFWPFSVYVLDFLHTLLPPKLTMMDLLK